MHIHKIASEKERKGSGKISWWNFELYFKIENKLTFSKKTF